MKRISNIEIIDSIYRSNRRIITLQKRLFKHYCPICSHIMHSKGIYTRTINHPIMQDGRQLIIKLNQRRWKCTNPICGFTQNDGFSFIEPYRRNTKEKLKDIIAEYDNCPYDMFHTIANSFIMVERHCHGDTYIKRLSNGPAEALNRIVKDMKRNGRGYKNFDHLRNRFLYSQGANAAILGTSKPLEEVLFKKGISRGPYSKKSR